MIDPTHPDVARVLHLLDDCDVCMGAKWLTLDRLKPRGFDPCFDHDPDEWCEESICWKCGHCNGHGKALHPDRITGALMRWCNTEPWRAVAMGKWAESRIREFGEPGSSEEAVANCRAAAEVMT